MDLKVAHVPSRNEGAQLRCLAVGDAAAVRFERLAAHEDVRVAHVRFALMRNNFWTTYAWNNVRVEQ